jgi:HAD superfamily hydrolase (TIGR01509 family)
MKPGFPRFLFLDIGHVLVGLDYERLAGRMQALTGLEPGRVHAMLTAEGLLVKFESGKITETEFYEEVCRCVGFRIPGQEFLEMWDSVIGQPLIPEEVLQALAQSTHLWAISNTNKLHFDFMARQFTFLRHFEGLVLSYEAGALKPDKRIFLHALEKAQARASEVLLVDDQEINVKAAQELGIDAFRFLNPDQFLAELRTRRLL